MQIPKKGIVFPDGESKDKWGYRFAAEIDIPEDEQKDWPIEGQEGKFYSSRLDMENLVKFDKLDFQGACDELKIIEDVSNG